MKAATRFRTITTAFSFITTVFILSSCGWLGLRPAWKRHEKVAPPPAAEQVTSSPEAGDPAAEHPAAPNMQPAQSEDAAAEAGADEEMPEPAHAHPHKAHWSYEGETGPVYWGGLEGGFALCQEGLTQSPVNLVWAKPGKSGPIFVQYKTSQLRTIDNGHTVQVNFEPGSKAFIRGEEYDLLQMHFHTESEHMLSGRSFPLEIHFVHKNALGQLAVIGVLVNEGAPNSLIETIWSNLPREKNQEMAAPGAAINAQNLFPSRLTYYNYAGSLTTPPCTEGVDWNVLNTPITMSKEQIWAFRALYPNNRRPIQPLNGRKVSNY